MSKEFQTVGAAVEDDLYEYVLLVTLVGKITISSYIKDLIRHDLAKMLRSDSTERKLAELLLLRAMDSIDDGKRAVPVSTAVAEHREKIEPWWQEGILTKAAEEVDTKGLKLTIEERKRLLRDRLREHWLLANELGPDDWG